MNEDKVDLALEYILKYGQKRKFTYNDWILFCKQLETLMMRVWLRENMDMKYSVNVGGVSMDVEGKK